MAVSRQMSCGNSVLMDLQDMLACGTDEQKYKHCSHADNLLKTMYECYEEGKFCDVTLTVGSEKINAHKVVLISCSEYFKKLLDLRWNKSDHDTIVIKDFDVNTFKSMLNFAYTGEIKVHRDNVLKLLSAGDFLHLDFIKESCSAFLKSAVNLENCLLLLATASKFNARDLVSFVTEYIANNYHSISQGANFPELPVILLTKVLQSESLIVDKGQMFLPPVTEQERYVLESVFKYISHQQENVRAEITDELLKNIRLVLLPASCLVKLLTNKYVSSCSKTRNLVAETLESFTEANATNDECNNIRAKQRKATKAQATVYNIHYPYHLRLIKKLWFDDRELAAGDETHLTGMKIWTSLFPNNSGKTHICGVKLFYSNGATSLYGTHDVDDVEEFHLEDGERIIKATVGSSITLVNFTFHTSKDRELGPFGDTTWGTDVTEECGRYGFLGYMRGSVLADDNGALRITKFSLVWKEFMLKGPYNSLSEERDEVQSLYDDNSDSQYTYHSDLLDENDVIDPDVFDIDEDGVVVDGGHDGIAGNLEFL